MRLLVVAAAAGTRRMLQKLAADGTVEIDWCDADDDLVRPASLCEAVLIDGSAARLDAPGPLLESVAHLRRRMPKLPVLVLSRFGAARSGAGCGVTRRDGMLHAHCRLRSLAWQEAEALLADALQRESMEPVTFEYQG